MRILRRQVRLDLDTQDYEFGAPPTLPTARFFTSVKEEKEKNQKNHPVNCTHSAVVLSRYQASARREAARRRNGGKLIYPLFNPNVEVNFSRGRRENEITREGHATGRRSISLPAKVQATPPSLPFVVSFISSSLLDVSPPPGTRTSQGTTIIM